MPSRNYDLLETIRQKVSMSQQIVKKDPDYALYAGADFKLASKMAKVDTMLKFGLIPKEFLPILKLYRSYLDQQRKAFFASWGSTELSKLGFLLGIEDDTIRASTS